jgi:hypothetical protein
MTLDPLNLPKWRKIVFISLVSICEFATLPLRGPLSNDLNSL